MIKPFRIIILEDNPTDCELIIRNLRKAQLIFEAKQTETKEAFLKELKEFHADIILSDFALPQFNGLEALRLLKELNLDIPFILCTGSLTEEVAVECMKEGATDYILKTSLKRLPSAISNALEKSETRKAQERALAALRESEQWMRTILHGSRDGIVIEDNGVCVYVNKSFAQLFGYGEPEEVSGKSISNLVPPEEAERMMEYGRQRLRGDSPPSVYEFKGKRKDGTLIDLEAAVSTSVVGNKSYIMTACRDITKRKRTSAALRESEYKMRTLVESMTEGLLQIDNEDRIQFVNKCLCEMVGYSEDELIGMNWSQLLLEEDRNLITQINEHRRQGISDSYEIRLRKKSGEILWMIVGGSPIVNAEGVITGSMGTFTDITERKRMEEQLLHDAFHDGLTGLANRTLFMDHLSLTIERSRRKNDTTFAVLFLDLDRFKLINDSLGHTEGDKLLKQIAVRLKSFLRPGDLVARLGGDEFTVLLSELADESDALRTAERIQEDLKVSFDLSGRNFFISASIGIALASSGHNNAEDMLRDADTAMYRAKAKGKAQYQVFDQEMHKHALARLQLETEMRQALERKEFSLYYQPIIQLKTNELAGFEALIRWEHPTRGMISPLEFIPVAEETGLIHPLGKWILYESCRQLSEWQNENSSVANIAISVNLSSKQFLQSDLAEQVASTLNRTGLSPSSLKLEITESHILENTARAIEMMNQLRALGVEISLDDFGTGYSSLSYLHQLPIDYLKIDRSFVSRMTESKENAEIVYTIIKLGQNLKMRVIAEGIETNEQLEQLKKLGCQYGQGYFFSKPLRAQTVDAFISAKTNFNPQRNFLIGDSRLMR